MNTLKVVHNPLFNQRLAKTFIRCRQRRCVSFLFNSIILTISETLLRKTHFSNTFKPSSSFITTYRWNKYIKTEVDKSFFQTCSPWQRDLKISLFTECIQTFFDIFLFTKPLNTFCKFSRILSYSKNYVSYLRASGQNDSQPQKYWLIADQTEGSVPIRTQLPRLSLIKVEFEGRYQQSRDHLLL